MSGGPGDSENVIITEPWSGARPHVTFTYQRARNAFDATNNEPYDGQFFARAEDFYSDVNQALNQFQNQSDVAAERLQDEAFEVLNGRYLNLNQNPHLDDMADAIERRMERVWNETILPSIRDEAIAAGAYGGSDQNELADRRAEDMAQALADALVQLYMQNYTTERGHMMQVPQWFQMIYNLKDARLKTVLLEQQIRRERDQIVLDERLQQHIDRLEARWRGIGELAHVVFGGGFSSQTSIKPTNPWTSVLQGVIGGAAAGTSLYGSFNAAGATAAAAAGPAAFAAGAAPWALPLMAVGGAMGTLS